MKKNISWFLSFLTIFFISLGIQLQWDSYAAGKKAAVPKLNHFSAFSKEFQREDVVWEKILPQREKYLIVNFWETTCGPCVAEIPSLLALKRKLGSKAKLVFINTESKDLKTKGVNLKKFRRKNSFPVKTYFDFLKNGKSVSDSLGIQSIPVTIVMDKNGKVVMPYFTGGHDFMNANTVKAFESLP